MASTDPLLHALFSCQSSWCVSPPQSRKTARPSGGEVPKTTEGLRMLASEGSWLEVLELAGSIERELIRAAPARRDTSPLKTATTTIQYDSAILQLVLSRVTAYAKMNDFGRAVQVLENLPWDYIDDREVPYSLIFLRAFLPMLISGVTAAQVSATQSQMYQMLAKVDTEMQQEEEAMERANKNKKSSSDVTTTPQSQQPQQQQQQQLRSSSDDDTVPYALLEHRRFRVARAIFMSHIKLQENISAVSLLEKIAVMHASRRARLLREDNSKSDSLFERIFITSPVVTKASGYYAASPGASPTLSPGPRSFASAQEEEIQRLADIATMEQMLCLQQAMCLALYSGNAPLSHQLRKAIEAVPTPNAVPGSVKNTEPGHLKDLMMCLNDSLLDVFFDRPTDAAARLAAAVGSFLVDPLVLPTQLGQGSSSSSSSPAKLAPNIIKHNPKSGETTTDSSSASASSSSLFAGATGSFNLPFYLEPHRALHVQYQFCSMCLSLIALVPHALHAPPTSQSQRAPASVESKRPQNANDTAALCNAALDRLVTCYPSIALRMPGLTGLVGEVKNAMTSEAGTNRRNVYQTVLSYLVAGRECSANLF